MPRLLADVSADILFLLGEGDVQLLWLVGAEHGDLLVKHVDDCL